MISPHLLIHDANQVTRSADLTCYWLRHQDPFSEPLICLDQRRQRGEYDYVYEEPIVLSFGNEAKQRTRGCLVSCYGGQAYSGTFRLAGGCFETDALGLTAENWLCSSFQQGYPFQTYRYAEELWNVIFANGKLHPDRGGLVVFSGSTNSAKTHFGQSFALMSIQYAIRKRNAEITKSRHLIQESRLPHLVTFEDPWETWKVAIRQNGCIMQNAYVLSAPSDAVSIGFCFTPRQKDTDIGSLSAGLKHAKRQTPTCFFVGEIRSPSEWPTIIDFAGSGHLIVVTTHASSLNETMSRILSICDASTAARRRDIGSCLLGVVHLTKSRVNDVDVVFPAVWAQYPTALSNLVAYGLSSIIPNGYNVLGYSQFCPRLARDGMTNLLDHARDLDLRILKIQ